MMVLSFMPLITLVMLIFVILLWLLFVVLKSFLLPHLSKLIKQLKILLFILHPDFCF